MRPPPLIFSIRHSLTATVCCAYSASAQVATPANPADARPVAPAPFVERIAGTTVEFTLVPIPAGTFMQQTVAGQGGGDPELAEVAVAALYISTTEVTWDMYDVFLFRLDEADPSAPLGPDAVSRPSKPYLPADRGFGHAGYPAISVSFNGAKEFCRWLSAKTGRAYRLPTVDEWEYAARGGGRGTEEITGETLEAAAWHHGNSGEKTHTVGTKAANAWGLHDTLGNVAEWTVDAKGKGVAAGGSFLDGPTEVSPDAAMKYSPLWNESDPQIPKSKWWMADCGFVGFRVVCEPGPSAQVGTPEPVKPQ